MYFISCKDIFFDCLQLRIQILVVDNFEELFALTRSPLTIFDCLLLVLIRIGVGSESMLDTVIPLTLIDATLWPGVNTESLFDIVVVLAFK
jgi:hypothetical protein